jgi:hypothetical protein
MPYAPKWEKQERERERERTEFSIRFCITVALQILYLLEQ